MPDGITKAQSRDEEMRGRGFTPYIVGVEKIDPGQHDVYDQHADPDHFYEIDSERKPVGADAVYGQYLDPEGYEAFLEVVRREGSNGRYLEEDVVDTFPASEDSADFVDEAAAMYQGTDKEALRALGFLAETFEPRGYGVLEGVGDTGTYPAKTYVANRMMANWDWVGDYGRYDGVDHNGHGAFCTGAALAPRARLVSGKVLDKDGSGYRSHIIAFWRRFADYCWEQGKFGVCSLSLGASGRSDAYDDASRYAISKRVITVAAVGNYDTSPAMTPAIEYGVIGVTATGMDFQRAGFANYGEGTEIAAPGVNLEGWSGVYSGSSMATPYIARLVAYLLSERGNMTDARRSLKDSALPYGQDRSLVGVGVPRVGNAMERMAVA